MTPKAFTAALIKAGMSPDLLVSHQDSWAAKFLGRSAVTIRRYRSGTLVVPAEVQKILADKLRKAPM